MSFSKILLIAVGHLTCQASENNSQREQIEVSCRRIAPLNSAVSPTTAPYFAPDALSDAPD